MAHPVIASSPAVPHDRLDDLDVACASRGHNATATVGRNPVDEGQPPQGEAAAAREVKEPGLSLAVERRALAAARDGHFDGGGAADLAAQLEVRTGRQVDGDVGRRRLLDQVAELGLGRRGDIAGGEWRQRQQRRR